MNMPVEIITFAKKRLHEMLMAYASLERNDDEKPTLDKIENIEHHMQLKKLGDKIDEFKAFLHEHDNSYPDNMLAGQSNK